MTIAELRNEMQRFTTNEKGVVGAQILQRGQKAPALVSESFSEASNRRTQTIPA